MGVMMFMDADRQVCHIMKSGLHQCLWYEPLNWLVIIVNMLDNANWFIGQLRALPPWNDKHRDNLLAS